MSFNKHGLQEQSIIIGNGNSLWELTSNISCGSNVLLGDFILDAAPFLYPFLIEFSLIAAAVLHLFWAHVGFNPK